MLRKSKAFVVEFCDGCSRVCDAACRSEALREHSREQVLRYGVRPV